jgi:hypothetical protein
MLATVTLFAGSASAQSEATRPDGHETVAEEPRPDDLKRELDPLKAENAAIRELLRKSEEQQRALLEQVDRLQRRLDGVTTVDVQPDGPSQVEDAGVLLASDAPVPASKTRRKRIVIRMES